MATDLFPYKSGLGSMEPVALRGHNVCIQYANDMNYRLVKWLEPLPPFQFLDIGAIAANTVSARTQANLLQAWRNEFLQIRWYPIDTIQVRLFLPNADGRSVIRNIQIPVDPTIVFRNPDLNMTEFYVWEDRNPAFEAINYTAGPLTQSRLIGMGYRFITDPLPPKSVDAIKNGTLQCTYLGASGYSGTT